MILELTHNITLLITLAVCLQILNRWIETRSRGYHLASGLLFAAVCIVGMMTPMRFSPGVIYDGRTIVLSLAGLFGGPVTAAVAALISGAYRAYLGGAGAVAGILSILESAFLGTILYYLRRRDDRWVGWSRLWLVGLLVHVIMLAVQLLIPGRTGWEVLQTIGVTVLGFYPLAFVLIAQVFLNSERKQQVDEALRASETKYRTLLENLPQRIFLKDRQSVYLSCNENYSKDLGIKPEDIAGKSDHDFHPPDLAEKYREDDWRLMETGQGEEFEELYLRNGLERWIHTVKTPIRDAQGRVNGILGIFWDVTDRKHYEKVLKASEERFKTLSEESPFGISLITDTGRYKYINPAFINTFGYTLDDFETGMDWFKLAYPDEHYRKDVIRHWKNDLAENPTGRSRPRTYDVTCKDGSVKTILFRPVTTTSFGHFVLYEDITEKKLAEAEREKLQNQLIQAQKMEAVGTLAGGVAHDFNNLLQAINGCTQLLLMDKGVHDPEYSNLMAIQKAGDRAASLVRQLLQFSRKAVSERRCVDLNQEIGHAKRILERTIPRMVGMETHLGDRLWPIMADAVQIEQILLNLGTNASDAMPDGGKLVIETENVTLKENGIDHHLATKPGRYALLMVSDTGQGMDKETIKKIFDPFFTTKEFGKGTGLGLASVYGIVKSHGGYINCYSEIGKGTTFKIYFPAIQEPTGDEPARVEAKPLPEGNETVLLVDDEEAIRDFAREALMKFGFNVLTASTGEESLELYASKSNEIDLIIMDLGMPGMGGHKCLQALLQINPAVKIIIASGYSINGQVKKSMEAGAKGFVGKPYQLADLLNTVRMVLDGDK